MTRVERLVTPGDSLFRVTALAPVLATVRVPETASSGLRVGATARVLTAGGPERRGQGHPRLPVLDAASGTREVVLQLAPGVGDRRPAASVTVQLGAERRRVVAIPRAAVARDGLRARLGRQPDDAPRRHARRGSRRRPGGGGERDRGRRKGGAGRAVSAAPRLRADLTIVEQTYRGEQSFIVKDPKTRKYFRFRPVEIGVLRQFDGTRSAAEVAAALAEAGLRRVGGRGRGVRRQAQDDGTAGAHRRRALGADDGAAPRPAAAASRGGSPYQGDIFRIRWSMGDPDHFMDRTIPYLRWMFTGGFLVVSVALFAVYLLVIALKWSEFTAAFGNLYHFRYSAWELFVLWVTATVIIVIHELGHGYTCKYFGGQVHEIGAMLLYFEPAFFCNVNDAWTFPELKARLWVTAAGSWIQLVAASLAAIVWWAAAPGTLVSHIALSAVLIGGVTTIAMNANPLIPLDGYFALSDYLEVPNLRQRAFAHLAWVVKTRVLRLDLPMPAGGRAGAADLPRLRAPGGVVHHLDPAARGRHRLRLARPGARRGGRRPLRARDVADVAERDPERRPHRGHRLARSAGEDCRPGASAID